MAKKIEKPLLEALKKEKENRENFLCRAIFREKKTQENVAEIICSRAEEEGFDFLVKWSEAWIAKSLLSSLEKERDPEDLRTILDFVTKNWNLKDIADGAGYKPKKILEIYKTALERHQTITGKKYLMWYLDRN